MPIIRQAHGAWAHFSVLEAARDWLWMIRVLLVVRFEVRCVGIWKCQGSGRRLRGDGGGGSDEGARRVCDGIVDMLSGGCRSRHVVGIG